ncbi:hypothetical protein BDW22DRAFT_764033 [Trametopsis cervina]|nr:hypothetical protein BDW22DRAFT_764033 [Trametopsis cervina]
MHPCLLVSEIFDLIAQFANEDGSSPSAVASLARTCRAFQEPAEDVLWRRLNGLVPLMHCFRGDICSSADKQYYFTKPFDAKSEDWQRFTRQAKRVHALALGQSFDIDAEMKALQVLDLCRPASSVALLPNLRELRWCDYKEISLRYMHLFAHPGLVAFNALIIAKPHLLSDTLSYLSIATPGLKYLKVTPGAHEHDDSEVSNAVQRLLVSLPGLAEFSARAPLCATTLHALAYHPRLEILSVRLPSRIDGCSYTQPTGSRTFRTLRRLTVFSSSIDDVVPLLNIIQSPRFVELALHVKIQPTVASLRSLFAAISRHHSIRSLSILVASSTGQRPSQAVPIQTSAQYVLTGDVIRALHGLRRLAHLILTQIPTDLGDQAIFDMAAAWPHLERLSLGTMTRLENRALSLEALRYIASSCPRLRELALTFNSALPGPSSIKGSGKQRSASATSLSRLELFDVGCSEIHDVMRFAQFLANVFPRARACDRHGPRYRASSMALVHKEKTRLLAC